MNSPIAPRCVLPVLLVCAIACSSNEGRDDGERMGPIIVPLDSFRLVEADTLYIGNPYTPVIDRYDGSIYVPDIFSRRVLRFSREGTLLQVYGRPGNGPGEFRSAEAVFVETDSTIGVYDNMLRRLTLFDRASGAFRSSRALSGVAGTTPPIVRADEIWFPLVDQNYREPRFSTPRSIAVWSPSQDTVMYLGRMPAEFVESIQGGFWNYANFLLLGALTVHDRGLLRGWQLKNELFLLDGRGEVRDTIAIPIRRRKGVPANVRELLDVKRLGQKETLEDFSRLRQLHTLSDGSVIFTHHDQHVLKLEPTPVLSATVWVGVLSSDLKHACVDALLPVSQDARSMETFRGDTLFQLDRRIVGGELQTWIRSFKVDTRHCIWIPVE